MRRAVLVLCALAACDHEPAPAARATAGSAAPGARTPDRAALIDPAKSVPQPDPVTPDCIGVAEHLVDMSIAVIADPFEQSNQISTKAKSVRLTAESCTRGGWTPAVIRCFTAAATAADLAPCNQLVMALPKAPPR